MELLVDLIERKTNEFDSTGGAGLAYFDIVHNQLFKSFY